jgi:hypothetical protein
MRNNKLPKTPIVYVDGFRKPFRPQCAYCGVIANEASPNGWDYLEEINPNGYGGYICLKCQKK